MDDIAEWEKTGNAQRTGKELRDVQKVLKEHLKVTDLPQH